MLLTKQVRACRIGDILLYKNEENPRFDTHDASDEVNVRGTQGVLF